MRLKLCRLAVLLVSSWLPLRAQPEIAEWRARHIEVPGLTLAISCDKTVLKKNETAELPVKLQYSGNDKVWIEKPDSDTKLLWLFHIEVKVPLPASIPFARTAAPTPEGTRLIFNANPFNDRPSPIRDHATTFQLNTLYQMQQPGDYKVTVWSWIGAGPRRDAKWGTFGSNELTITVLP